MSYYGKHPSLRRTTEPVDTAVWHWFVCNGPHGENFSWHKDSPHPKRNIELLSEFITEKEKVHPKFIEKARLIAIEALEHEDFILVLKAIQVLTVIGTDEDMLHIQKLLRHSNKDICKHARCAMFERGIKRVIF